VPGWLGCNQQTGSIEFPSWSHDGQYLYFDSILTKNPFFRVLIFASTTGAPGEFERHLLALGTERRVERFGAG
jgi:hypothetical protein